MSYYVYIMTNKYHTVLYTGVTNNLARRVSEHKNPTKGSFTSQYRVSKLVYAEYFSDIRYALEAEKQIKGWVRSKKIALIEGTNPEWKDLYAEEMTELN